ncbi:hypothetical protein EAL2_808p06560 (plasmid) [Peptoclostridium acidaminophilum DSM 3953]|uniref:Uncharacterized protein n=1 Tax=Peptoclostridium acidaminophilum DSM 3953 TaxID=1286171 RepID=W8T919_PEPAC|nr:hypothetical protein EAL2_808p06560 [Peptoclostridium acidaminophilum DSM 3953]
MGIKNLQKHIKQNKWNELHTFILIDELYFPYKWSIIFICKVCAKKYEEAVL